MSTKLPTDEWQALYRQAVSSYYIDPVTGHLLPAQSYQLDYQGETELLSGAAFLSHQQFEQTIGQFGGKQCELIAIEVPTYTGTSITNFKVVKSPSCNWQSFDKFQTSKLFKSGMHLGVAVLDRTGDWVLVKDPDVIYLFSRLNT